MMKLDGDSAFLELDRSELGSPETPADQDVLLNVTVQVGSYSAADQCWIAANDLKRFLSELRELEASRQGQAVLLGASLDDLRLEFYSTDSYAPLLLIHGDAEDVIPFQQAELMYEAVKKVGVPVKLLRVPGGTHVNLRTKDAPDYLGEMVKWHEQHLRGTK
jgi:acetyl esterase/lipase